MKFKLDASEFKFRALEFFTRCVAVFCISREFSATSNTFRTAPAKRFTRKHKKTPKTTIIFEITAHPAKNIKKKQNFFAIFCFWSVH